MAILYRKLGVSKVILNFVGYTLLVQAIYLSIIALTRVEVNRFTMPVSIALYALTQLYVITKLENKKNSLQEENKDKIEEE